MKHCLIHIGMHKTGSTSIQASLNGYADDFFFYAGLGHSNHSVPIYSLCAAQPEEHPLHKVAGRDALAVQDYIAQVQRDLARSAEAAGDRTLILSGEAISMLRTSALRRLREILGAYTQSFTIAGYVRPLSEFVTSAFQQRVKTGAGLELAALESRNYERLFAKFDSIFGRENVQLRRFDPRRFEGACVVRDFCAWFGISLVPGRVLRLNESLSRETVSLLFTYFRHGGEVPLSAMEKLTGALAPLGRTKLRLSPELVRPILERSRADIAWMEARLGEPLEGPLGEHQPGDVRSESDLLTPDPALSRRLIELLGERAPAGITGETPEEVAYLVHCLLRSPRAEAVCAPRPAAGSTRAPGVRGFVEFVRFVEAQRVCIRGWAVDEGGSAVEAFAVKLEGTCELTTFERINRLDVARARKVADPWVGFELEVPLVRPMALEEVLSMLEVCVRRSSGELAEPLPLARRLRERLTPPEGR